ncbi:xylanase / acetylxylan esterase [Teredinibacter turnerae T7901]|uniref:endo-1,4-beta-xylanase n=1 Tax=Teredinibacter turnerae (strain ATCC 39867 / T7901) TaxID=377629 RepID=C5BU21_TERTT|nr:glycoside hydrolase family 11 protein [Teredinibacter turnerae]ACR13952.1 xylanase / acetylxylan esterase [Teredinibacter turnerae T7901]
MTQSRSHGALRSSAQCLLSTLKATGLAAAITAAGASGAFAQTTLTSNSTGTHGGHYYSFWKDSGDASFTLHNGGRYASQWSNSTNNWVGGKGWNPGGAKVVNYEGYYGVSNSQNSYLALYGWTRNPLIEYYVIESYGSYNPSSCNGGTNYGSFQSDGATYNVRRCQRVNQPSIDGTATFYQYFSVRSPKKGFGQISGTINVGNHFNYWASQGLNLGSHDYMVLATEGYQSSGNSDISVSEGSSGGSSSGGSTSSGSSSGSTTSSSGGGGGGITVRARGTNGDERISLRVGGSAVASWTLSTSAQSYSYTGGASGDIQVEFTNDASGRDVILDYIQVNGETRQAEDMEYNTSTYANGECGGGSYSETMHCNGVIGFGDTTDCFSGSCSGSSSTSSSGGGSTGSSSSGGGSSSSGGNCSGYVGITFDDGPGNYTNTLINALKTNNLTPVTWFVQGQYIQGNSSAAQQLMSVGEIQNHSWNHPDMSSYSYSQVVDQISRTTQAIRGVGAPSPTLYRPPYGNNSTAIQQAVQNQGLRYITWDVDSRDWDGASSSQIAAAAGQLQNGQVILMHDHDYHTRTINAIPAIASGLRSRGLCAGRIDPNTGRAVAPSGSTSSSSSGGGSTSSTSSSGGGSSSSSSGGGGSCVCNWWGTTYPICQNSTGWGWENNRSCIGTATCNSQGTGGGGVVCN